MIIHLLSLSSWENLQLSCKLIHLQAFQTIGQHRNRQKNIHSESEIVKAVLELESGVDADNVARENAERLKYELFI